jgi:hypothetical protein
MNKDVEQLLKRASVMVPADFQQLSSSTGTRDVSIKPYTEGPGSSLSTSNSSYDGSSAALGKQSNSFWSSGERFTDGEAERGLMLGVINLVIENRSSP